MFACILDVSWLDLVDDLNSRGSVVACLCIVSRYRSDKKRNVHSIEVHACHCSVSLIVVDSHKSGWTRDGRPIKGC